MYRFRCIGCDKSAAALDPRAVRLLREEDGWHISEDLTEAACDDCVRDVHEEADEGSLFSAFSPETARRIGELVAPQSEPESPVPGALLVMARFLQALDRPLPAPTGERRSLEVDADLVCTCDEQAPNYHGGYGVCPIHPGDHQLAGDSIGGHVWQGADVAFRLVDGEPSSFQDADDDTWHRQDDGSYRMDRLWGEGHMQPSLRAAVRYAGLQADENLVLDALADAGRGPAARTEIARLARYGRQVHTAWRSAVDRAALARENARVLARAVGQAEERVNDAELRVLRQREVERNQDMALNDLSGQVRSLRERNRVLQEEIARVVEARGDLERAVEYKDQQLAEVRRMYEGRVMRVGFLEEALAGIEKIHRPEEYGGRTGCPVCGTSPKACITYEEAGALHECGRPYPGDEYPHVRCVRSKSHLGLHRDTAERRDARHEWDSSGEVM